MSLDEGARIAQIVTACIAVLALFVAWISIHVQRGVARRRAAIEFFLKAEMDAHVVEKYNAFNEAIKELGKAPSIGQFAESKPYEQIRAFLYILELMAVGIHNKIFDQRICYDYWGDVVKRGYTETKAVVDFVRAKPGCDETFSDLIRLHNRWSGRRWVWQRWRSRWWPFQL
jgi:hypothetical protein